MQPRSSREEEDRRCRREERYQPTQDVWYSDRRDNYDWYERYDRYRDYKGLSTRDTTRITPPVTTNDGKTTTDMTINLVKGIDTKRISIRNVNSKRGVTHGNRRKALQVANWIKAKQLPQDLNRV